MKYLKTFENYSQTNEEISFGFGVNDKIKKTWEAIQGGNPDVKKLKSKFEDYGTSFGFDGQNAINYAAKLVPNLYNYLYKNGDIKTVTEEEIAKIYFSRSKSVKKEGEKWIDTTAVGAGESGPGGRTY